LIYINNVRVDDINQPVENKPNVK